MRNLYTAAPLTAWMPALLISLCIGCAGLRASDDGDADSNAPDWPVIAELSERRLDKETSDEKAWADLVRARLEQEDYDRAEKALARWRSAVAHPSPIIELRQAELFSARGELPRAITAWERYLQRDAKDKEAWTHLAAAYASQQDFEKAAQAVSRALKLEPNAARFAQRASYRVRLHDWTSAEDDVREANRLDASDAEAQKLVPVFEQAAEWLPVIKKLDAAVTKNPTDVSLRLHRAEWLIGIGLLDAGADDVEAAFKLNPASLRARLWHGVIAHVRGEHDKAGDVMPIGLDQFTSDFEAELKTLDASPDAEARAAFLLRHRQPLLALAEVENVDGSPAKALALLDLNRLPEAGVAARRAVESRRDDSTVWFALARLEMENGNIAEALRATERSMKLKKTPEAAELRKAALRRLGRK